MKAPRRLRDDFHRLSQMHTWLSKIVTHEGMILPESKDNLGPAWALSEQACSHQYKGESAGVTPEGTVMTGYEVCLVPSVDLLKSSSGLTREHSKLQTSTGKEIGDKYSRDD